MSESKNQTSLLVLLTTLLFGATALNTARGAKAVSEWVHPGEDAKLVYKTTPQGDRIMDFSHAGYMGGGVALPVVPVKRTVKPSGSGDDTATIQAAINEVAAMPLTDGFRGAVLLAPGVFPCSNTITISTSGVVLRGSGSGIDRKTTTIKMIGGRHTAIQIGGRGGAGPRGKQVGGAEPAADDPESAARQDESAARGANPAQTSMTDAYVPSGAMSFAVADPAGFAVGDTIEIRRPVTADWVRFMQMDTLTRNGRAQGWLSPGSTTSTERRIAAISGNTITLDVPVTDSFDSKYVNPPGATVSKIRPPTRITQSGIEHLHIQAPPIAISFVQAPYSAMRINGEDCWARDVVAEETMGSVGVGGRRITLERVALSRTVPNLGAAKPAEFAPNASQLLLDRCSSSGDNIFHVATGARQSGPIVLLNCAFSGNGHIEGHARWTTGILVDNCSLPGGGLDFKNRGAMGSGHGWGLGWAVAWNCTARTYVIQQPPGTMNWMIGCIGPNVPTPRPFDQAPTLPLGTADSPGKRVAPQSLYLAQLAERLGPQALKNIGYSSAMKSQLAVKSVPRLPEHKPKVDKVLGPDEAFQRLANPSNVRNHSQEFAAEKAMDGDDKTYWATDDAITGATLELDLEGPVEINALELGEAVGLQHIQEYKVEGQVDSDWKMLSQGTTIGDRKIDRFPKVTAWKVRLTILKAEAYPAIRKFGLYLEKSKAGTKR